MLADIAQEFDVAEAIEPVGVIDEDSLVVIGEIEKAPDLLTQRGCVVRNVLLAEHLAHLGFTGRVADAGGAAADQDDGTMAVALEVTSSHDRQQMANMHAICGGIDTYVKGFAFGIQ